MMTFHRPIALRFSSRWPASVLALMLTGCGERPEPEPHLIPAKVTAAEITVNGTLFSTKDVIRIKTGPNATMTGDGGALFRTFSQDSGVIDLHYTNGDIIRVSPTGSFTTVSAPRSP